MASYNPEHHEAPVVVGHPKSNGPAYGWVEKLKRVGGVLMAKLKQVEPAFAEIVEAGRYKKRSASFYADGSLRHVGFLGAQPPAVKGLKDFAFDEGEDCHEYEQPLNEEVDMTKEEFEKKLAEERRKREAAEADAVKFKEQAERSGAEFAESQKKTRDKEIRDFIEAGIKDGKILPAWKEQGLAEFMGALEGAGGEYEFCEGKKQSPAAFFREFLEGFGRHPLFKEMARPKDEKTGADAEFEEDMKAAKQMAAYVNGADDE